MLSYQHIYHAGNMADVQKHALLAWTLDYMTRKDKPISYIETHSGRGIYDLGSDTALKTGEATGGISRLRHAFAADHPYMRALAQIEGAHGAQTYAGSPVIAGELLRAQDKLHLSELHPQEFEALSYAMSGYSATCYHADGFQTALSITPPTPRRGILVIDPSYEIKSDYADIPKFIGQIHRKWNVGVIALWYPILTNDSHKSMISALTAQALPNVFNHEIRFPPVRDGHRMIGSGMFLVNAPFGIEKEGANLSAVFASQKGG